MVRSPTFAVPAIVTGIVTSSDEGLINRMETCRVPDVSITDCPIDANCTSGNGSSSAMSSRYDEATPICPRLGVSKETIKDSSGSRRLSLTKIR